MAAHTTPEQLASTEQKLNDGKQRKETGDQAFKAGKTREALRSYHEALMYLLGIDKNALKGLGLAIPQPEETEAGKEKTEVDEIVEKIHANMSACHLKLGNWQRAIDTADKALAKNEANYKAMFRKGKALGEMGFFEKCEKLLEDLKKKNPDGAVMVDQELSRLRAIDNEREKVHKQKLKGFLNKSEKKTNLEISAESSTGAQAESSASEGASK